MATAALLTKASKWPRDSTTSLVLFQSAISTSTMSMDGYSLCRASKWDRVRERATIFAPARHNSTAMPRPIPENHNIEVSCDFFIANYD